MVTFPEYVSLITAVILLVYSAFATAIVYSQKIHEYKDHKRVIYKQQPITCIVHYVLLLHQTYNSYLTKTPLN
jgi:hypothetical protein